MSTSAAAPPPNNPVPATPRTFHRFHRAHIVRDTMARRFAKLLCSVFLSLLFAAALLLFFLFLILRPHRPRFHLTSLSLDHQSSSLSFNVSDRNPNREIGIHYDSMSGSLYYRDDEIAAFGHLLMPFYQPPKNTTAVVGAAEVRMDEATASQMGADLAAGRVGLRLELRSAVRFRVTIWDTHRHRMHVSCKLEVDGGGNLAGEFRDKRCPIYFL